MKANYTYIILLVILTECITITRIKIERNFIDFFFDIDIDFIDIDF